MPQVTLGTTGIITDKNAFGALPVQRVPQSEAVALLRHAYEGGITFFDTARSYSDSEGKMGLALAGVREKIIIATKTPAQNAQGFWEDLGTSLRLLKTDYVDIYQLHNPAFCPKPGDGTGLYEAMLEARAQGKIKFIGITNHRLAVALEAVESGLYDTLQYPFSYLAHEREIELVRLCEEKNVGFIAMKALSGGLITCASAAYAFLAQYKNVLPIWGIQREGELREILSYIKAPPEMSGELQKIIEKDRAELLGEFCRGCGYCLPCPANIDIAMSARMALMLRRAPPELFLTPEWREKMARIENCTNCRHCAEHCPYSLDTPRLLRENLADYKTFLK